MYNSMKRFQAAAARRRFSELLDAAEHGETVVIERRGVRFRVEPMREPQRRRRRTPLFQFIDPAVEAGEWTWGWGPDGLRFVSKLRR
jgi:prevent-host-death family protein